MTPDSHTVANIQIHANPDGSFTISDPTVAVAIATLTGPQMLEACGWIIGKAAVRALAEPEAAAAPAVDPIERRPGYWTLKAHAISMPPGIRTPDAVRAELYGLGIRFLEGHVSEACILFKGCAMVPVRLPGWLTADPEDGDHA